MSLSIQVSGYTKPCANNTGGVSRVYVYDPKDMDWTQAAATDPGLGEYTAVALRAGATIAGGSGFFEVGFDYLEGEYGAKQNAKGSSNKWAHELKMQHPWLAQDLVSWLYSMQKALGCSSLGFVIVQNNGTIAVIGEQIVNGETLPSVFRIIMDGAEIMSGKQFDDPNGAKTVFKGDYGRPPIFFTGGLDAIFALLGTPIF